MRKPIRKAVLPVAGLGTRFLPATKAVPKEMLTVVDRPILQHVVDEARAAGVEKFIFVTGRNKGVIEDHFDIAYELDDTLRRRGKLQQIEMLQADMLPEGAASFTRQQSPLGLGHAVWCARDLVGREPFALLLPDMITSPGERGSQCLAQCVEVYERFGGNVVAVEEIAPEETQYYGVVGIGADDGHSFEINGMVEKPPKGTAPSNWIIAGRYILQPEIFDFLENVEKGAGGEIQLTDSMIELAKSQKFFARHFDGKTYDTGSKVGYLAANVAFALARPDIEPGFRAELKRIVGSL